MPAKRVELLSNAFLAQLERLSLRARRPVKGWGAGQRRSRRTGHSVEFADYRAYGSGDDMRYVDWNIYGRTDRMHVKLFVDDEDLCLHLLIDASASMDWGTPSKLAWAARLAAALGFIGLTSQERVGLGVLRGQVGETLPPTRGRNRIPPMFEFLSSLSGSGTTQLNDSLLAYAQHAKGGRAPAPATAAPTVAGAAADRAACAGKMRRNPGILAPSATGAGWRPFARGAARG